MTGDLMELTNEEHTRMVQTHLALNEILARVDQLNVGLAMVWAWTWSTIKDYYNDSDLIVKDEDTVFAALWEAVATGNGFSLEYGAEHHEEEVRDWMFSRNLMDFAEDEELPSMENEILIS